MKKEMNEKGLTLVSIVLISVIAVIFIAVIYYMITGETRSVNTNKGNLKSGSSETSETLTEGSENKKEEIIEKYTMDYVIGDEVSEGVQCVAYIEIPKINVGYSIASKVTTESLTTLPCYMYGPGFNQVGRTSIAGIIGRFERSEELEVGDAVFITELSEGKVEYKISDIYETTANDADFMLRDSEGKKGLAISLADRNDANKRIIIMAEEI